MTKTNTSYQSKKSCFKS